MTRTSIRPRLLALATAAIGLAAFALLGPASPAQAHDQLLDVTVVASQSGEPNAVRLNFNDNVLKVGAEVQVTDPNGKQIAKGEPTTLNHDLTQALATPLVDGEYTGIWRVVSNDGHPVEGAFSFTVKNGVASDVTRLADTAAGTSANSTTSTPAPTPSENGKGGGSGIDWTRIVAIGGVAVIVVAIAVPLLRSKKKPE